MLETSACNDGGNQQQRFTKGKDVQRLKVLNFMNYIVYKTVNKINGKVYVGVHRTNPDIFDGYIGCGVTKHNNQIERRGFPAAVRKYGYENFERSTIKIFPDTEDGMIDAYKLEEEIVNEEFVKSDKTYNLIRGGKFMVPDILRKEIAQYTLDGKFIRTWSSITEAQEALGLTSINKVIQGVAKYCGDFQWKLYTDESDIEPVIPKEKSVYQFDLQGNLVKCWKSGAEASKEFDNPDAAKTNIWNVCNKITRQAYGYYWSFKCKFEYNAYKGTAVAKYLDDGTFVESYSSIREAAEKNNIKTPGNINHAISGKQKRCGGFRWRYFYGNTNPIKPL